MELTIASFISKSENFNTTILNVLACLRQENVKCELIIFSDRNLEIENEDITVIVDNSWTKYRRIQRLLVVSSYDLVLCIDNDISVNIDNLSKFLRKFATGQYLAGWGKIESKECPGIVPKLIQIDKNLSHGLIRPLLWKLKVGISMPGQVFLFNRRFLRDSLPPEDTVFDDLQIGLVLRRSGYPILCICAMLGAEFPKLTFPELIRQRLRWARGYAETISNNLDSSLPFVLIHGTAYHIIWILFWLTFARLAWFNITYPIIIIGAFLLTFAHAKLAFLRYALLYALIFPILHIIWLLFVALNLAILLPTKLFSHLRVR